MFFAESDAAVPSIPDSVNERLDASSRLIVEKSVATYSDGAGESEKASTLLSMPAFSSGLRASPLCLVGVRSPLCFVGVRCGVLEVPSCLVGVLEVGVFGVLLSGVLVSLAT